MSKVYTEKHVIVRNWTFDPWEGYVSIYQDGLRTAFARHERDIATSWPEDLKRDVAAEIRKHRPLAENETREPCDIGEMSIHGDCLKIKWSGGSVSKLTRDALVERPERLAFFDRHFKPALAENQVRGVWGDIYTFRWHDGIAEVQGNSTWQKWRFCGDSDLDVAGDAWFRKNCPPDRFVTDGGHVLEFRLSDDGEAFAVGREGNPTDYSNKPGGHCSGFADWRAALYRFRDLEQAKWSFKDRDGGVTVTGPLGWARYRCNALPSGWCCNVSSWPQWVRAHAEKLWEERRPKWRVKWQQSELGVHISKGDGYIEAILCRDGLTGNAVPPEILAQASALFREKYTLQDDEIWKNGEVVKLTWDASYPRVFFDGRCNWNPKSLKAGWLTADDDFINDAERLAAFDRCRAFYYEHKEDEAWSDAYGALKFEMRGDAGWASNKEHSHVYQSSVPGDSDPIRVKLRRWTEKQLAKRAQEKVTLRCAGFEVRESLEGSDLRFKNPALIGGHFETIHAWGKCPNGFSVTIEPIGEKS